MFTKNRIISHVWMWIFVGAGLALVFIFIPPGMALYKKNDISFVAVFLVLFLIYYLVDILLKRKNFHLASSSYGEKEMKKMIKLGVYGKCIHPTCTTLAIFGWIIFLIFPELRMFLAILWFNLVVIFWIRVEKSFFLGKRLKMETGEDSGPG